MENLVGGAQKRCRDPLTIVHSIFMTSRPTVHDELAERLTKCFQHRRRILASLRPLSHWKLISNFMQITSFRKKISCVNSQLSKEINFEIIFRDLAHVLFGEILQKKFHLWSAVIGQSTSVYEQRINRRRCCLHMAFESLFPM